jgi:hypothetical protein
MRKGEEKGQRREEKGQKKKKKGNGRRGYDEKE